MGIEVLESTPLANSIDVLSLSPYIGHNARKLGRQCHRHRQGAGSDTARGCHNDAAASPIVMYQSCPDEAMRTDGGGGVRVSALS